MRGHLNINRWKSKIEIIGNKFRQVLSTSGIRLNLTHTIKHLSFGTKSNLEYAKNRFQEQYGELSPLNDHTEISESYGNTFSYVFNIVPHAFYSWIGLKYPAFIYTYFVGSELVGVESVEFNLSVKGITFQYYSTSDSLLQLFSQTWFIIWAVIIVAKIAIRKSAKHEEQLNEFELEESTSIVVSEFAKPYSQEDEAQFRRVS